MDPVCDWMHKRAGEAVHTVPRNVAKWYYGCVCTTTADEDHKTKQKAPEKANTPDQQAFAFTPGIKMVCRYLD